MATKHEIWCKSDDAEIVLAFGYTKARSHLAKFGISLEKNENGEYRMNKGKREATAYYTDDLSDAIATAYCQYINKDREDKSYDVITRQSIERIITAQVIKSALEAGCSITVDDGEEEVLVDSKDMATIMGAMFSTDEDTLYINNVTPQGWVKFIYGNSGYDVIHDYTTNLEAMMTKANELTHFYE